MNSTLCGLARPKVNPMLDKSRPMAIFATNIGGDVVKIHFVNHAYCYY